MGVEIVKHRLLKASPKPPTISPNFQHPFFPFFCDFWASQGCPRPPPKNDLFGVFCLLEALGGPAAAQPPILADSGCFFGGLGQIFADFFVSWGYFL